MNPYAESWVATVKRECLDHFFVFGEKHLRHLVTEYVKYYNTKRPRSGLSNMPIRYKSEPPNGRRRVCCKSVLGGMIKHYYWN